MNLETRDQLDHPDHQDPLDQWDHVEHQEREDVMDLLAHPACVELMETQENKDQLEMPDHQDPQVSQATLELREMMVPQDKEDPPV